MITIAFIALGLAAIAICAWNVAGSAGILVPPASDNHLRTRRPR